MLAHCLSATYLLAFDTFKGSLLGGAPEHTITESDREQSYFILNRHEA
jgi:hypothetical protein